MSTPEGLMTNNIQLEILGSVPPKKNRYRMGGGRMFLSKEIGDYQKSFNVQCREQLGIYTPRNDLNALSATFYYKRDTDLDNLQNGLFDALQSACVIENDKQITFVSAEKFKDAKNPRVIINLSLNISRKV